MEDIIDIIVTETTNLITITSSGSDEVIDVNIIDNREDIVLNVTPSVVEININSLTSNFGVAWGQITGTLSNQTDLNTALGLKADLVGGKVPSSQLPSYVDDIVEVANYAALPATGETGKIYITLDTNFMYRWSGSTYIEIKDSSAVWGAITGTLSSQTDLQNALNAKFDDPTGDTTQYIAGDGSLITFPISGQAGTLVREVRNTTGATLTKGTIVYISGATGNKPTVSKAIATGDSTSAQTFGMCQANIANNSNGYVVCVGDLAGLDTSAFTEGNQLYLSSTTAGTYTTTKQLAPAHLVYIGIVTRAHPTLGQIEVNIQNGYELYELHDVSITSESDNQGLFYEASTDLWKNKSIATVLGYTPANGANYLPLAGGTMSGAIVGTTATFTNAGTGVGLGVTLSNASGDGIKITHSAGRAFNIQSSGSGFGILINNETASTSAPFTIQKQGASVITLTDAGAGTFNSSLTASSFVKTSGTSSQFLKADGSVDSSTYVKGSGTATYLASWTSTANTLTDSFISFASNITSVEGMGLSSLNGIEINGNYGGGAGGLKIKSYDETTGKAYINFINDGGVFRLGIEGSTGGGILPGSTAYATVLTSGLTAKNLEFGTNNAKRLTLDGTTGAATFTSTISATGATLTGALSGTSATFSGNIRGAKLSLGTATTTYPINVEDGTQSNSYFTLFNTIGTAGATAGLRFGIANGTLTTGGAAEIVSRGLTASDAAMDLKVMYNYSLVNALTLGSNGAATFSSSVTATQMVVGNTSFNGVLSVVGNGATNGLTVKSAGNVGTYPFRVTWSGGTDGSMFCVNDSGNVGIGTTSPSEKLHIAGPDNNVFLNEATSGNYAINRLKNSTYTVDFGVDSSGMYLDGSTGSTRFYAGASERMRITSDGLLQFSTTSVVPTTNNAIYSYASNGYMYIQGGSTGVALAGSGDRNNAVYVNTSINSILFHTNGAGERMRITSGGSVLIGVTDEDALGGITIRPTGTTMVFNNLNTAPTVMSFQYNSSAVGSITRTTTTTSYNITSDYRLKEDLKTINGLDIVNKIKVYDYKWKSEDTRMDGVMAHELAEVLPYAVTGVKDGEQMQSVDYSKIVPVMVQAIKEEDTKIITLQNKVNQLEIEIQTLKNK